MKNVLCVCGVGYCRSPTAARVLANDPYNFDTRSAGIEPCSLIPVTDTLLQWANIVVCMEQDQKYKLRRRLHKIKITETPVLCLDIPDDWFYNDPELIDIIKQKIKEFPILDVTKGS